ncbi:hypothetical protein HY496_01465 [Candidatus Woesearchaeota archaeon]|nr:hypothetical protein [Candidatus Woesearchaeota archaeon]
MTDPVQPQDQGAAPVQPNQGNAPVVTGQGGGTPQGGGGEPQTYELPDGRQVSAEELAREWKENFLPDYTRKSQELSNLKKTPDGGQPPVQNQNPWTDPNYVPKTWEEIFAEVEKRLDTKTQAQREQELVAQKEKEELNKQIDASILKIKETDKTLNEDDMFRYAAEEAKKGVQYSTVEALYGNYKQIEQARLQGQRDALKNIQNRQGAGTGVGSGGPPGSQPVDLNVLRKSPSIADAVQDHLRRLGM